METFSDDMEYLAEKMDLASISTLYQSLDSTKKAIRLCKLHGGSKHDYIRLTIFTADLSSQPEYDALSYVWRPEHIGGRAYDSGIYHTKVDCLYALVRAGDDGAWIKVALEQNLVQALTSIRKPDADCTMWIDAVSINQHDVEERNSQVGLMSDIYSSARQVVIWLGVVGDHSDFAMRCMATGSLYWYYGIDARGFVRSLSHLIRRAWFSRLWVVQELVLSKHDPIVVCGDHSIPWTVLYLAVAHVWAVCWREELSFSFRDRKYFAGLAEGLAKEKGSSQRINDNNDNKKGIGNVFFSGGGDRRYVQRVLHLGGLRMYAKPIGFADLLELTQRQRASNPRDKIFGILGLADSRTLDLKVDYSKSVSRVFAEATAQIMLEKFEILYTRWTLADRQYELPSWVPDFSHQDGYLEMLGHSPQGLAPHPWDVTEALSKLAPPSPVAGFRDDHQSLSTVGVRLGRVLDSTRMTGAQHDPLQTFRAVGPDITNIERFRDRHGISSVNIACAILGSDYDEDYVLEKKYQYSYETVADLALKWERKWESQAWTTKHVLSGEYHEELEDIQFSFYDDDVASDLLTAIEATCRSGRELFVTDTGRVGLAPQAPQGGEIFGLFGINLPFVLQKRDNGEAYTMLNIAHVARHHLGNEDSVEQFLIR